ncbi:hypothetical protein [Ignavigranum ruoffiae]|uniref:hypothetical protein n=1 Tax=Ignavigranum ruoffiae TaxID=89093 RepID=UPI0024AE7CAC|nr:hypothetical protein [Ignavigranum ruoffiae]
MAKKFIGPDGKVYKQKKNGGCLTFIFIAAIIGLFGNSLGLFDSNENMQDTKPETEVITTQTPESNTTESIEEIEIEHTENEHTENEHTENEHTENNKITANQINNINTKLSDDLNESHQFAINGDTDYDAYLTIDDVYLQEDGILVAEVNGDFFNLSDDEKDLIANSVHGMGQLAKYDILKDEEYLSEKIYMSFRYGGEIIGNTSLFGTGIEWK